MPIREAFEQAVRFVRIAILSAPGLGAGHGPLGHHLGVVPFDELEG
jgi:hydroxymethylpyrimidine/phosphomethylpyrimidine kinase